MKDETTGILILTFIVFLLVFLLSMFVSYEFLLSLPDNPLIAFLFFIASGLVAVLSGLTTIELYYNWCK
jgi:uncharacterized membrane protein